MHVTQTAAAVTRRQQGSALLAFAMADPIQKRSEIFFLKREKQAFRDCRESDLPIDRHVSDAIKASAYLQISWLLEDSVLTDE